MGVIAGSDHTSLERIVMGQLGLGKAGHVAGRICPVVRAREGTIGLVIVL